MLDFDYTKVTGVGIIKTFFETMRKNQVRYLGFLIFFIAASAITATTVVLMTRLTGDMSQAALDFDVGLLQHFVLLLTGIFVVRAVSSAVSALFLSRFQGKAGYKFRQNFAQYFLRVPFQKFEELGSGQGLSIYSNDVPMAISFVGEVGMSFIGDFISLIASLVFMLTINVPFTLIFIAMFPAFIVLQVLISKPIQKRSVVRIEATADFNAVVNDSLQNVSTIVAYGLEEVIEQRYLSTYDKFMDATRNYAKAFLPLVIGGIILSLAPQMFIAIAAATSVINGNMEFAEFIALIGISSIAGGWLMMLGQQLGWVQTVLAGAKRFNENTSQALENLTEGAELAKEGQGGVSVTFEDVSFSYGEDLPYALDGVSFSIAPGSRVAFVGGSGSGKSTVLKLLLGLYEPNSGKISISGTDVSGLSKNSLRNAFAYVPQDSFLFPESIGKNIAGANGVDFEKLEKAGKDAGILDFINSLPKGFDGELNEAAENISGGQRQRIAMARAFYKDAPVILFDEATSALDPTTEAAILESLNQAAAGKTILMVAHRANAIAACDSIVVMDNGKISEIGSHEDLLKTNDVYRNLYIQRQEEGEVVA